MGLLPDKPNPPVRSFSQPDGTTRRCCKCLVRKPDDEFRWLTTGLRRSSRCKPCEKADRARRTRPAVPTLDFLARVQRVSPGSL